MIVDTRENNASAIRKHSGKYKQPGARSAEASQNLQDLTE